MHGLHGLEVALTAVVDGCMAAAFMTCMVTLRMVEFRSAGDLSFRFYMHVLL